MFKEFINPGSEDYDLRSFDTTSQKTVAIVNDYSEQLVNLIGFLEDDEVTDEYLLSNFGISKKEYIYPTSETIKRVSENLNKERNFKSR